MESKTLPDSFQCEIFNNRNVDKYRLCRDRQKLAINNWIDSYRQKGSDTNEINTNGSTLSSPPQPNPKDILSCSTGIDKLKAKVAERGFDARTSGLWAQHAPTAPLCLMGLHEGSKCLEDCKRKKLKYRYTLHYTSADVNNASVKNVFKLNMQITDHAKFISRYSPALFKLSPDLNSYFFIK